MRKCDCIYVCVLACVYVFSLIGAGTIERQEDADARNQLLPALNLIGNGEDECTDVIVVQSKCLNKKEYLILLVLTAWANALTNGILPSIQSYSCLPYGIQVSYKYFVKILGLTGQIISKNLGPVCCISIWF